MKPDISIFRSFGPQLKIEGAACLVVVAFNPIPLQLTDSKGSAIAQAQPGVLGSGSCYGGTMVAQGML